jgi:large subunit ribosomal protein L21
MGAVHARERVARGCVIFERLGGPLAVCAARDDRYPNAPHFHLSKRGNCGTLRGFSPEAFTGFRMAYAIIKTGGRQHRVAEGDIIDVDLLEGDAGKETIFGDVLFHGDGEKLTHGSPLIEGATVTGEVIEQRKDKKVIAFKYRRRKGYHRTVGHRRKLTRIKITGISLGGKTSKAKKAKAEEAAE